MPHPISHHRLRGPATGTIIAEVLDSAVTPERRELLVSQALGLGALKCVPPSGPELDRFLDGPLRMALDVVLGSTRADEVVGQVVAVVAGASLLDGPRSTEVPPRAADESVVRPVPPGVDSEASVVIITSDLQTFARVSQRLHATVRITRYPRITIDIPPPQGRAVVLVDGREGPRDWEKLPRIAEGHDVVLWGLDAWPDLALLATRQVAGSFTGCACEAWPVEVAVICRNLSSSSRPSLRNPDHPSTPAVAVSGSRKT